MGCQVSVWLSLASTVATVYLHSCHVPTVQFLIAYLDMLHKGLGLAFDLERRLKNDFMNAHLFRRPLNVIMSLHGTVFHTYLLLISLKATNYKFIST